MMVSGAEVALGLLLALVFGFVVQILFILNLQRTLERVSPENRAMSPGLVWLQIIPLFGVFWFFYVVVKMRDSLRQEFRARGWPTTSDFGLNIGIASGVLQLVAGVVSVSERLVYMTWVLLIGVLVCLVIYWVRIAAYKAKLGPPVWAPGAYNSGAPYPPPYDGASAPGGPEDEPGEPDDLDDGDDPSAGGQPGADPPLCPACGASVKPYDRFCYVCGSRLPCDE